ncbi:MAG: AMP-binding protein, partial [Sphingomonadales bacterium]|nr:AMP-binding protein [Sphingomonadales bacterium]
MSARIGGDAHGWDARGAAPEAARRYGDKTALVVGERKFSFNELEAKSNAFANGLAAAGIAPGDIVTLYGPNSWQWLVAYYGIAKTGAVVNPANTMLTPEEVKYIVEDSGARAVVASGDKAGPLMDMKGNTGLSEVVIWGDKAPAGAASLERWLDEGKPAFAARPRSPKDTGAICYTSGTTGHPRGAVQSIRSVVAAAKGMALMGTRTQADTIVSPLPCPHVYGSISFNAAMLTGSTFVMLARFSEEGVLDAIQKHRATMFDCVPTAYYYLLAHPKFGSYNLSSLTRCTVGGQTMPLIFLLFVLGLIWFWRRRFGAAAAAYVLIVLVKPLFGLGLALVFLFGGGRFRFWAAGLGGLAGAASLAAVGWAPHLAFLEQMREAAGPVEKLFVSHMFAWLEPLFLTLDDYEASIDAPAELRAARLALRLLVIGAFVWAYVPFFRSKAPAAAKRHVLFVLAMVLPILVSPVFW